MSYWLWYALILLVAIVAIGLPILSESIKSPKNEQIGQIPIMSLTELEQAYHGTRVLVVGGTRGVGLGIALAVARAGAHVTIVGRSPASGQAAMQRLKQESALSVIAAHQSAEISFVAGDIGSLAASLQLVADLEAHVGGNPTKQKKEQVEEEEDVEEEESSSKAGPRRGFDYLVVTAAVFPDWTKPHQQEDGIDNCFFIAVVGRYILFKNMARFMNVSVDDDDDSKEAAMMKNENVRVLNVMGSGELAVYLLEKDVASGKRDAKNLIESMLTFSAGNELMLLIMDEDVHTSLGTTRVSTHPGFLETDLHRGQGWLRDKAEVVIAMLKGISIEDCGKRQASILASPKLPKRELSYVSSDMVGRLKHAKLVALQQTHQAWLEELLHKFIH